MFSGEVISVDRVCSVMSVGRKSDFFTTYKEYIWKKDMVEVNFISTSSQPLQLQLSAGSI